MVHSVQYGSRCYFVDITSVCVCTKYNIQLYVLPFYATSSDNVWMEIFFLWVSQLTELSVQILLISK